MDETRRGIFRDAAIRRYVDGRAEERDRAREGPELPPFVGPRTVAGLWLLLAALAFAGLVLALILVGAA